MRPLSEAVRREPLSAYAAAVLSLCLSYGGDSPGAIREAERASELAAAAFISGFALQNAHYIARNYGRSIEVGERVLVSSGRHPWGLMNMACALADSGERAGAEAMYAELGARAMREYVAPFHRGYVAALIGRLDDAEGLIREAIARRDPTVPLFGRWAFGHPSIARLPVMPELAEAVRLL